METFADLAKPGSRHRRVPYTNAILVDYDTYAVKRGKIIHFYHCTRRILTLDENEVFTVLVNSASLRDALRLTSITGAWFRLDASNHRRKKQTVRVQQTSTWPIHGRRSSYERRSYPLTEGMQLMDGRILNPEICVDYARRIDCKKHKAMLAKYIKPFTDFSTTCIKMDAFAEQSGDKDWVSATGLARLLRKYGPTDARCFDAMFATDWYVSQPDRQQYQRQILDHAEYRIKKAAEELRKQTKVYYYVPVEVK